MNVVLLLYLGFFVLDFTLTFLCVVRGVLIGFVFFVIAHSVTEVPINILYLYFIFLYSISNLYYHLFIF